MSSDHVQVSEAVLAAERHSIAPSLILQADCLVCCTFVDSDSYSVTCTCACNALTCKERLSIVVCMKHCFLCSEDGCAVSMAPRLPLTCPAWQLCNICVCRRTCFYQHAASQHSMHCMMHIQHHRLSHRCMQRWPRTVLLLINFCFMLHARSLLAAQAEPAMHARVAAHCAAAV